MNILRNNSIGAVAVRLQSLAIIGANTQTDVYKDTNIGRSAANVCVLTNVGRGGICFFNLCRKNYICTKAKRKMLEAIRIQNFRSIKDVTLNLQQINLLIGANNSGKSNFLKALEFFGEFIFTDKKPDRKTFGNICFNKVTVGKVKNPTSITLFAYGATYRLELYGFDSSNNLTYCELYFRSDTYNMGIEIKDAKYYLDFNNVSGVAVNVFGNDFVKESIGNSGFVSKDELESKFLLHKLSTNSRLNIGAHNGLIFANGLLGGFTDHGFVVLLNLVKIYKPNPETFSKPASLQATPQVNSDGSNIVPFLFNLGQNHKKVYARLEKDLALCVGDLVGISTPVDPENPTQLKIKFFDKNDQEYWADEVSGGVLYFLALLCIIHQPNPPQLLLLEEPEKGIHPVRIQEVMNFIFKLAEQKNIQIILTSHSPLLLEEFKDLPESVFIFDKENGATSIKNLKTDVIDVENEDRSKKGLPEADYTSSLMSHWTVGLIGGVPKP